MRPIRFIVADDSDVVRQELRQLIASNPQWQVVAEATNGITALKLIGVHQPDIALIDVAMPCLDGIRVTQEIKRRAPALRVIVYTAYHSETLRRHALAAGADAFFWKEDLDDAVLQSCAQSWFPSGITGEDVLCMRLNR